jgi:predicted RND superfamily exporter protein
LEISFEESDLPDELRERYVSEDGQYRIEVFPKENINDIHLLERFVSSVRTVAPEANDAPVTMLESANAVTSASLHAFIYALTLIAIFLYMVFKDPVEVILVIIPIIMSLMLTSAVAALLGMPYNFANIIVIPLILGIGVDDSIHIIHHFRRELSTNHGLLGTSTARAVLFSALTTIVSFGSLSILDHRGTASLGKLLTLSMGFIILSTLVVLPALLKIYYDYLRSRQ